MLTVVLRTALVYILLIAAVRLMGKRQLGELQPSELVTTILISNLASLPIEETDLPLIAALAPIFLIACLEVLLSILEIKSSKFSRLVSGNAKTVIQDGIIDQNILHDLRYSIDDLLEALRGKDVFDIRDVEYGVIETNGQLNIYKKHEKQNPTNDQMSIARDGPARPPIAIVIDGIVQPESLKFCKKNNNWLEKKLRDIGIPLDEILLLQCDVAGDCVAIRKEAI